MKRTFKTAGLLAASVICFGAVSFAKPAPDFSVAKVLNAPVKSVNSLKDLKGKVVFLEYWATWCGPCVASIPHMNRLEEALKGEPVVFLSVTDEPEDKIAAFLKTHEMKAWVGLDEKHSSFKAYKISGRPDGYLIGKDGGLLARVFPVNLQESTVREAIAGKMEPQPVEWPEDRKAPAPRAGGKPLFELVISSSQGKPRMSGGYTRLESQAMSFKQNIAHAWDVENDQVLLDTEPVKSFNLLLQTPPGGMEEGREALKAAIQSAFGVKVARESRETDVYALRLSTEPGAPRPDPGAGEVHLGLMSYGGGTLVGTAKMPEIANGVWASMDRPVVDETGLKGVYEFELNWDYGSLESARKALAAKGLLLEPSRAVIDFVRVTPAK